MFICTACGNCVSKSADTCPKCNQESPTLFVASKTCKECSEKIHYSKLFPDILWSDYNERFGKFNICNNCGGNQIDLDVIIDTKELSNDRRNLINNLYEQILYRGEFPSKVYFSNYSKALNLLSLVITLYFTYGQWTVVWALSAFVGAKTFFEQLGAVTFVSVLLFVLIGFVLDMAVSLIKFFIKKLHISRTKKSIREKVNALNENEKALLMRILMYHYRTLYRKYSKNGKKIPCGVHNQGEDFAYKIFD